MQYCILTNYKYFFFTGNQFTTLDGFVFEWSVTAVTRKGVSVPSLTHKVIKLMKFEESHYKVPSSSLAEIESAGLHGNKVLLFGMSTGQAQVGVSLLQPQYEGVQPAPAVVLSVIANLVLDPQDSLLLPNTKVSFTSQPYDCWVCDKLGGKEMITTVPCIYILQITSLVTILIKMNT